MNEYPLLFFISILILFTLITVQAIAHELQIRSRKERLRYKKERLAEIHARHERCRNDYE